MIKLNLGCGMVRPEGWINTDSSINSLLQSLPVFGKRLAKVFSKTEYTSHNASYMNLNKKWKYKDNSVDIVYSSHLFEHLSKTSADLFLRESYRCLKPGGVFRIVVPDLYYLSKKYVEDIDRNIESASDDYLYNLNLHKEGQYQASGSWLTKIKGSLQDYPHQHKYMYDKLSLKKLLMKHKFTGLKESSYGESVYLKDIIHQVENTAEGVPAIYLEATKPIH